MRSARQQCRKGICVAIVVGHVLSGCSTQVSRIGPDDGSDGCRAERVALDSTRSQVGENVATGAVIGVLGGALAGYLAGRDTKSALIGATAGAALGAAGGYWAALQQQQRDQALLAQQMLGDVQQANAQIDYTQLAFDRLIACRSALADRVRADLVGGRITRAEAERQMATLRQQHTQDIAIARRIETSINARSADFEFANEQINPKTYVAVANTPLRATPADAAAPIDSLAAGASYMGSRANDHWVKIYLADGRVGYAPTQSVSVEAPTLPAAQTQPRAPSQQASRSAPATATRTPSSSGAATPRPSAAAPTLAPGATATSTGAAVNEAVSTNLAKKTAFGTKVQTAEKRTSSFELSPSG